MPCDEVKCLERELKSFLIILTEVFFNNFHSVCILIKILFRLFLSIIIFLKILSVMCETKTVLVSLFPILILGAGFCFYRSHTEKKVRHHTEIKTQSPCEIEYITLEYITESLVQNMFENIWETLCVFSALSSDF